MMSLAPSSMVAAVAAAVTAEPWPQRRWPLGRAGHAGRDGEIGQDVQASAEPGLRVAAATLLSAVRKRLYGGCLARHCPQGPTGGDDGVGQRNGRRWEHAAEEQVRQSAASRRARRAGDRPLAVMDAGGIDLPEFDSCR